MKHLVNTYADATENVAVVSCEDLDRTYLEVGTRPDLSGLEVALAIDGTPAERAAFLLRLISAASNEVSRLEYPTEVPA